MMSMELSKKDTKMIQGLSVLAMVCLHLFDRYDYEGLFCPLIFLHGYPLSFYFGQICDFCVMGFAFCSGYSHMAMIQSMGTKQYYSRSWKRIAVLYCNYWIVLVLFTILSLVMGQGANIPGSLSKFLGNFFGVTYTYNESWWYLFSYVVLVALSPILLKQLQKRGSILCLAVSFAIYLIAFYVRYMSGLNGWVAVQFGKIGMTLFEYILGAVFFAKKFFSKLKQLHQWIEEKIGSTQYYIGWCLVLFAIFLGRTLVIPNMIVAPFSGLVFIVWFSLKKKPKWIERIFLFFGTHSTNIWLTHFFFYAVIFVDLVYIAKYPILIYLFMLIITSCLSVGINKVLVPIRKVILNER